MIVYTMFIYYDFSESDFEDIFLTKWDALRRWERLKKQDTIMECLICKDEIKSDGRRTISHERITNPNWKSFKEL